MSANIWGNRLKIMSFGESHGPALGVVIDGCPAGLQFDLELLTKELQRRRPGTQSGQVVSKREEADAPEVLSGVFEGRTLGTPIAVIVRNQDARSQDYSDIKNQSRAGHADDVWLQKFGHRDYRGGGRSSGRETLSRVIAGAVAKMFLAQVQKQVQLKAYTSQVGLVSLTEAEHQEVFSKNIDDFHARFPSARHGEVHDKLLEAQQAGTSLGGFADLRIRGVPAGWGQPVFHKLKSDMAQALMSIGAVNGVELGSGFQASTSQGQEFHRGSQSVYGGIRGGISTGEEIHFRISFKPTSSILDVAKKGRHDPFIVTRAVPVIEAMAYLVLADHFMWIQTDKMENFES